MEISARDGIDDLLGITAEMTIIELERLEIIFGDMASAMAVARGT